ncbi:methyltransferase FkbM family [Variovorax paradoxus EPS]|uniref:Methyltransferase FkbM family n=2 Tax=Variovorax paradoxus TaxID=34073 RepID=E6V5F7_VARPE|nr:methyltransferase FkbM family [Variovorax paradoxus EPS]
MNTMTQTTRAAVDLRDILAPRRLTEVVDVGANPIDGDPPYLAMLQAGLCRVTGFEPQLSALHELTQAQGPLERYLPWALGDGGMHTLHVCAAPGMTSLLAPDAQSLALFEALQPLAEVRERIAVQTRRLDDIAEIAHLDFLKIDVQGSELAVFRAGRAKLAQAVMVQTEVSFVTLYKDQPTQGEIDQELRGQGFVPHCFAAVKQWPIAPCVVDGDPRRPLRQLLEADLVYMRDIRRPEAMDDEQLRHLALVAHHCHGSFDLALRCLLLLEERRAVEAGAQQRYLQLLAARGA